MFTKKFNARIAHSFLAALASLVMCTQALGYGGVYGRERAEPAEVATVIAVVPQWIEERQPHPSWERRHGPAALGAGLGAVAARNSDREVQVAATLLGGYLGHRVAESEAERPRRVRGFDTILEYEDGRRVAIFSRHEPGLLPGDEVFLIGRNRIVRFR